MCLCVVCNFVCDVVCFACCVWFSVCVSGGVCVLLVMYCVMMYGVLLCVRGCCFRVWFVSMCVASFVFDALCGVVRCWCCFVLVL